LSLIQARVVRVYYFDTTAHWEGWCDLSIKCIGWLLRCMALIITCTEDLNQDVTLTPVRLE